jgi:hypothetical protein
VKYSSNHEPSVQTLPARLHTRNLPARASRFRVDDGKPKTLPAVDSK